MHRKKILFHSASALGLIAFFIGLFLACGGGGGKTEGEVKGKVGETIKTDDFEIKVTKVFTRRTIGSYFTKEKAAPGAVFVVVRYWYKNISKEPISSFSFPDVKLVSPDGVSYDNAVSAASSYKVEAKIDTRIASDLNPGIRQSDAEVFEVASSQWNGGKGWKLIIDADKDVEVTIK
ncbi:MAG: DUF4352 domain-containing protein [Candidatus Hydrogenedentota bacterium]|nr:MAG: DUF4352 domain-containing protein [Candidatus Hydrogenedentota bacterium]